MFVHDFLRPDGNTGCRIDLYAFIQPHSGALDVPLMKMDDPEVEMRHLVPRAQIEGGLERGEGRLQIPAVSRRVRQRKFEIRDPHVHPRVRIGGIDREIAAVHVNGPGVESKIEEKITVPEEGRRVRGIILDPLPVRLYLLHHPGAMGVLRDGRRPGVIRASEEYHHEKGEDNSRGECELPALEKRDRRLRFRFRSV